MSEAAAWWVAPVGEHHPGHQHHQQGHDHDYQHYQHQSQNQL